MASRQIALKNLSVQYLGFEDWVLKEITVFAPVGAKIGLVGPSKGVLSTLLNLFAGIIPKIIPAKIKGKVTLGDNDYRDLAPELRKTTGVVLQDSASQLSGLADSVYDELAFALVNRGLDPLTIQDRVAAVASQFDLEDYLEQAPTALSGGQMQRLAIASALALNPQFLLLDDPTSQMDPVGRQHFFSWLKQQKDQTVFIASGEVDDLAEVCDQIWVLEAGRLAASGTPQAVFNQLKDDPLVAKPTSLELAKRLKIKRPDGSYPVTASELKEAAGK